MKLHSLHLLHIIASYIAVAVGRSPSHLLHMVTKTGPLQRAGVELPP